MTRVEVLENVGGVPFEFDNGDNWYIDFDEDNQILFAGPATNAGVMREVEFEYDNEFSFDRNIQALYDKCIEEKPELNQIEEPEIIEEEVEEQPVEESDAPTIETHDGGILNLDENGDIQITYPGNENEAETSYVVIDLETYANTDELTITQENFHEMIDELLRQCDLDELEAQQYIESVLSYLNINMVWDNEEEESSDEEETPNEEEEE